MIFTSVYLRIALLHCLLVLVRSLLSSRMHYPIVGSAPITDANHCTLMMAEVDIPKDSECIKSQVFDLSSGIRMKVLYAKSKQRKQRPPILFLHGSFHGAWCWAEHYMEYFTRVHGYPTVALNWRGTGGAYAGDGVKKVKIQEHVADLRAFLEEVLPQVLENDSGSVKPIVVCHSFGGLALMKYLEKYSDEDEPFSAIITMCSVPPSGNGKMTMRFLRRSLSASWKITAGFAMKRCLTNPLLCRDLFFGGENEVDASGVSDEDVARYQALFTRDSEATTDLFDLAKQLPSSKTDDDGCAPFLSQLQNIPRLVMGCTDDFIVDREGLEETSRYFGLDGVYTLVESPHDVMLGPRWQNGAEKLLTWLETSVP